MKLWLSCAHKLTYPTVFSTATMCSRSVDRLTALGKIFKFKAASLVLEPGSNAPGGWDPEEDASQSYRAEHLFAPSTSLELTIIIDWPWLVTPFWNKKKKVEPQKAISEPTTRLQSLWLEPRCRCFSDGRSLKSCLTYVLKFETTLMTSDDIQKQVTASPVLTVQCWKNWMWDS